jgi:hypothetical protein
VRLSLPSYAQQILNTTQLDYIPFLFLQAATCFCPYGTIFEPLYFHKRKLLQCYNITKIVYPGVLESYVCVNYNGMLLK